MVGFAQEKVLPVIQFDSFLKKMTKGTAWKMHTGRWGAIELVVFSNSSANSIKNTWMAYATDLVKTGCLTGT